MPQPTSDESLNDAATLMDRALESERGISVSFATRGAATSMRFRCYTKRTRYRHLQSKMGNPHISPWDELSFTIEPVGDPPTSYSLIITKGSDGVLAIKEL